MKKSISETRVSSKPEGVRHISQSMATMEGGEGVESGRRGAVRKGEKQGREREVVGGRVSVGTGLVAFVVGRECEVAFRG